jgi:hypothetical protein
MPSRLKLSGRKFVALGVMLLIALVALAQGAWSLGRYTFTSGRPSAPLQYSLANSGGLGSYGFVSGVGGVAFSGTAKPDAGVAGKLITLHYAKGTTDGHRLQVLADTGTATADLPDWMLVPIARFADSEFDACVSLFGPNTNAVAYDIVYHKSFQNTLLGMRLLQADMVLFDLGETWRLPQRGGVVVLGLGESAPSRIMDEASAQTIDAALQGGAFQSWVMTDQDEEVVFALRRGRLDLTGQPYYYFWTSNVEAVQAAQRRLESQALEMRRAGRVSEHNRIVEQLNAMVPTVSEVTTLTGQLKGARGALRRFNPAVYDAATQTMRYSAFFRYVKKQNHDGWKDFVRELASVTVQPDVTTPTRWAR